MKTKNTLRTFYILIATQTLSLIGSRMTGLAIGIKVYADTNQATPLALAAFFAALPSLVSASVAGVLADRWNRRYVMMIADAGQAVGTLILLITFATGTFEVWHLYVVSLIQAVFGIFQDPAFQASVTMLVPDDHRDRANVIQQLTGPASSIVAPVLAGLLFAMIGATGVMTIDLITFWIAVGVVFMVHIPQPKQTEEGRAMQQSSIWKEALTGLRFLKSRQVLLASALHISLVNFLIGGAMVLNTAYVLSLTNNNSTMLGTMQAVFSAGALTGGIIMSKWGGTRPRIHTIMPGIILVGLWLTVFGAMRRPVSMGIALFFMALPLPMINASFMSFMQLKIPPDLQGRVFSTLSQIAMLLNPLAYLVAGPLADKVFEPAVGGAHWGLVEPLLGTHSGAGMGLILVISGSLIMVVTALVYLSPAIRCMEVTLPDYNAVAAGDDPAEPDDLRERVPAAAL